MQQSEISFVLCVFKKLFFTTVLCSVTCFLFAQEVCDNGKDDDNDGWIDLQDPDCECKWTAPYNLLLNPSFEEYKHCLTNNGSYAENYDIANDWLFGVQPNGDISFYRNFACPMDSEWAIPNYVPQPIPDGTGFIELTRGVTADLITPESGSHKYYVAQCLQTPLIKDRDYTFSFYGSAYRNNTIEKLALDSFSIAVFGHPDCNAVPFGVQNRNNGCPTNFPGWVMLGKATFASPYTWVQAKMRLTIPEDINVIEVGYDCSLVYWGDTTQGGNAASKPYYYLDNFQLAETKDFNFQYIQVVSGDACNGNYALKAPASQGATYQWYKDSIALIGQTDSVLRIPEPSSSAYYNVRVTKDGRCQISEPFLVERSLLEELQFPQDTFLCKNDTLYLGRSLPGVKYQWDGKQDVIVTLTEPGLYNITGSDSLGCSRKFSVNATFKDCFSCAVYMPSAFTPNGDGINEVLRGYSPCPLDNYQLQIYNRWGQKIFETNTISKGWDGTLNGKKSPIDVYVYFIRYKNSHNEKNYKITKGTVALIR